MAGIIISETASHIGNAERRGEAMTPDMELALSARAENIAIVRHALGGLGEAFALSESRLADIRLAVTEACANVVVHAYPNGDEGPMEVLASIDGREMTVLVRDWGAGIRPRSDSPGLGLGLSLIAALAEKVQLGRDEQEHTEVRMTFALDEAMPARTTDAAPGMNTLAATPSGARAGGQPA